MKNRKVLIVDDEPDVVESLKFALNLEGIETVEAYDGEEGLKLAKEVRPALVLLDVMLPKINGYKLARLLKFDRDFCAIPIIMLTARAQESDMRLGESTGANEYITKPFDIVQVIELVQKYLRA